ncbi:MAG: NAD(P)-dependent oxidoreductase [Candidatus Binatia bacterium]
MQTKVGFIGLGQIGKPMAINAAKKGFDLMVYDLQEQPTMELAASGAKIAVSAKEVAAHSEIVQIAVRDGIQVEALVLGEAGVLASMKPGSAIAVHSTIHPKIVKKIGASALALRVGVIDAAISGGESGASAARLAYMVGGDKEWVEKCRPVLAASGENIFHVGELGKGLAAKLCHQLILCINMISAYEGTRLGDKAGVDLKLLQEIVHLGSAQSNVMDHWQRYNRSYDTVPPGFALFYKDLGVVLEFAHDLGISLPGAGLVQQMINPVLGIEK